MSSDIYAKPDFSKVRYNRRVQEEGAKWEEKEVEIYESADCDQDNYTDIHSQEGGTHTQKRAPVQHGLFRAAVLGVGVLSLLLIIIIIILSINSATLKKTIQEKQNLETRYNNLNSSYNQLQEKLHMKAAYISQLRGEVKTLKKTIQGKGCPDGWKRFGCSCYFKSTETKTWENSRRDCQNRGADLVVIDSHEEQEFIRQLNNYGESWIGLRTTQKQGYTYEWEWVDGSLLTPTFWARGQENSAASWPRGTCCDTEGKWTGRQYNYPRNWICEK